MSKTAQAQVRNYPTSHFGIHDSSVAHGREEDPELLIDEDIPVYFHPALRPDEELVDLEFLAHFVDGSAFYAEALEDEIGELLEDFWQAREHAYHIVTSLLLQRLSECRRNEYEVED